MAEKFREGKVCPTCLQRHPSAPKPRLLTRTPDHNWQTLRRLTELNERQAARGAVQRKESGE